MKDGELTNSLNLKIDKLIKENDELEKLVRTAKNLSSSDTTLVDQESEKGEDKTIPVSELFGEDNSGSDTTLSVADNQLFDERPYSSLLRNIGGDMGVPEKNIYALKKILSNENIQAQIKTGNGQ